MKRFLKTIILETKKKIRFGFLLNALFLIVMIIFTSCSNKNNNSDTSSLKTINFGKQNGEDVKWIIILDDDSQQILLSEKVLDVKLYNENEETVSWENSTLYDYLNTDFINEYFSKNEIEKMIFINDTSNSLVTLPTTNNLLDLYGDIHYMKDGFYGDKDFFAPNDKILAYPANNAINNDIDPFDNEIFSEYLRTEVDKRYEFANGAVPYWLLNQNDDGAPLYVTSTGYISSTEPNTGYIGIRPIIRLKVNAD